MQVMIQYPLTATGRVNTGCVAMGKPDACITREETALIDSHADAMRESVDGGLRPQTEAVNLIRWICRFVFMGVGHVLGRLALRFSRAHRSGGISRAHVDA